jgi:hypothetical protein
VHVAFDHAQDLLAVPADELRSHPFMDDLRIQGGRHRLDVAALPRVQVIEHDLHASSLTIAPPG